jgi:hypothetical protein
VQTSEHATWTSMSAASPCWNGCSPAPNEHVGRALEGKTTGSSKERRWLCQSAGEVRSRLRPTGRARRCRHCTVRCPTIMTKILLSPVPNQPIDAPAPGPCSCML